MAKGLASATRAGEGEAIIFDFTPIHDLLAEERRLNRDRYEKEQARKANQVAALNALDDKLKVDGHYSHQQFLQGKLDDLQNWAMEQYAQHGESVFADNFEKRREWEGRINDFKKYNQYSANIKSALQSEIDRAKNRDFEISPEDKKSLNDYLDMSLEDQMKTSLPTLREREYGLEELYDKAGYGKLNVMSSYKSDTDPDEEGVYYTKAGTYVDKNKIAGNIDAILRNVNTPFYRALSEKAVKEVKGSGLVPETLPNGEENPDFSNAVKASMEEDLVELMKTRNARETSSEKTRKQVAGAGKEEANVFEPIGGQESGVKVSEKLSALRDAKIKLDGKDVKVIKDVYTDDGGKHYYKSNVDLYLSKSGKLTPSVKEAEDPEEIIPKGSVIDRQGNVVDTDDIPKLSPVREVKTYKTGESYSVNLGEKADLSSLPYYINEEGSKVDITSEQGFKDAEVTRFDKDIEYKESDGKIVFKGEDGYDNFKGDEKTEDFVVVTAGKGGFKRIPYTREVENKYPKLAEKVSEVKGGGEEVRRRTKDGRIAVFNADTKEFIRFE